MMRKGQQSIELMVGVAAVLAIFIIFYWVFYLQYMDYTKQEAQAEGTLLADEFAQEIRVAYKAGDGYSKFVLLPSSIPGAQNYSLFVDNRSGSVDINVTFSPTNVYYYTAPTYTTEISGESDYAQSNGIRIDPARDAYVENMGGIVIINQSKAG